MPCTHPLQAYRVRGFGPKAKIFFKYPDARSYPFDSIDTVLLPCGQCMSCRLNRSREWAIRCVHELYFHSRSCFITLTYNDFHLNWRGSVELKPFQDFMKRLRKHFPQVKIKFFHCAEYGSKNNRPHHHAILFGVDFAEDRQYWKRTKYGYPVFTSETLGKLWPWGMHAIGDVTFNSCAYVSRYITKKVNGPLKDAHYNGLSPEFATMSLKPAIGFDFVTTFPNDILANDKVTFYHSVKGRVMQCRTPKYYDKVFDALYPEYMTEIRAFREAGIPDKVRSHQENINLDNFFKRMNNDYVRNLEIAESEVDSVEDLFYF